MASNYNEELSKYFSRIAPSVSMLDFLECYIARTGISKNTGIFFYDPKNDNNSSVENGETNIYRGIFKIEPTIDKNNEIIPITIDASEYTQIINNSNYYYIYSTPVDGTIKLSDYSYAIGLVF